MKQHAIAVILLVAVVTGAGGFFAGTKFQQSKQPFGFGAMQYEKGRGMMQGSGNGTRTGIRNGFRPLSGEIIKHDETSMTVKLKDGSSKIVLIGKTTSINKAETGSKDDLTIGTEVAVFGAENSDGSVTAQNVQIHPVLREPNPTPQPTN